MKQFAMGAFASSLLAGLALVSGCAEESAPPPTREETVQMSEGDQGKSVKVPLGEEAELLLQTIGPGQYGAPELSSEALRFLDVTLPADQNPGGPRQLYRFEAVTTGTTTIHIPHTERATSFDVVVVVE